MKELNNKIQDLEQQLVDIKETNHTLKRNLQNNEDDQNKNRQQLQLLNKIIQDQIKIINEHENKEIASRADISESYIKMQEETALRERKLAHELELKNKQLLSPNGRIRSKTKINGRTPRKQSEGNTNVQHAINTR